MGAVRCERCAGQPKARRGCPLCNGRGWYVVDERKPAQDYYAGFVRVGAADYYTGTSFVNYTLSGTADVMHFGDSRDGHG